jgi:hypothetical protein
VLIKRRNKLFLNAKKAASVFFQKKPKAPAASADIF